MATIQLRQYKIVPGQMDRFVEFWQPFMPLRAKFDFKLLFAFVDPADNQFVWAVSHDGDFDTAEAAYMGSEEHARLAEGHPNYLVDKHVAKVDDVSVAV